MAGVPIADCLNGGGHPIRLCPILCLPPDCLTYSEVIRGWAQRAPTPHKYCVLTLRDTLAKLLISRSTSTHNPLVGGSNPSGPTN